MKDIPNHQKQSVIETLDLIFMQLIKGGIIVLRGVRREMFVDSESCEQIFNQNSVKLCFVCCRPEGVYVCIWGCLPQNSSNYEILGWKIYTTIPNLSPLPFIDFGFPVIG